MPNAHIERQNHPNHPNHPNHQKDILKHIVDKYKEIIMVKWYKYNMCNNNTPIIFKTTNNSYNNE